MEPKVNAKAMPEGERKELEILGRIVDYLSQSLDMEKVLTRVTEETAKLLRADASSIHLLKGESNLELAAGYNLSEERKKRIPLRLGEGLAGKVFQQKEVLFSGDITRNSRVFYPEAGKKRKTPSLICAPLISRGKLLGTLAVYSRRPKVFGKRQIRFLKLLAQQTSLAIERAILLEQLKEKAICDELTGLYSRGYFLARCREEFARTSREKGSVSFLLCDVNNFKAINRIKGHREGDRILCQVAEAIRSCVRKEDVVCRYGGDEFIVLLLRTNSTLAAKVAERIHRNLSLLAKEGGVYPTLSIGVVSYPEHGGSLEDILAKADSSMIFARYHPEKKTVIWAEWEKTDLKELYTQDVLPQIASALAQVVDQKDGYTTGHSRLVSEQAVLVAEKMGLEKKEIDKIRTAALLHDIGKLAIPARILNKPGRLTKEEEKIVRGHSKAGEKLLRHVKGFETVVPIVRAIHERWDGKGYPDGLAGGKIPLGARIIAVVDTYWAVCSDRPYRRKLGQKEAIKELKEGAGSQFDPKVVEIFLSVLFQGDVNLSIKEN